MIYLLHGADEWLRSERLAALRAALGPREMGELNTTWLDGRKTRVAEVCYHADVVPFLTERRLVIVSSLLAQLKRRQGAGKKKKAGKHSEVLPAAGGNVDDEETSAADWDVLVAYLAHTPLSTDLVLVEVETVPSNHRVYKEIARLAAAGQAEIVACEAPAERDLPEWVIRRAQAKGGTIEPAAAFDLASSVGRNLRLLENELDKLLAYRDRSGPIRRKDVRMLTPYVQEANIFDMVDAIGQQNTAQAVRLLHDLDQGGAAALYVLSMIVRQFRILVQVSDQMSQGLTVDDIAKAIGLHPFPTQKAMQQARRWSMAALRAAYDRLLDADLAIKTGKMPDTLAVELAVVELSSRAGKPV